MPVIMASPALPAGARSALVVGVGSYRDPGLAALRSPARDAEDLAHVLALPDIGGFAVARLSDPGVQELREGIAEFLAGRRAEELVVVYLSCHGVLDARRRLYFAATDTRKDLLTATAVPAPWLTELLEECRARRQVVILDCCFSGAFDRTKAGPDARHVGLDEAFGLADGRGRIVLTASRDTEYSFEGHALDDDDGGPAGSVFTSALVEGLRTGAADVHGDGLITVSDLYTYARARVAASGAAQTPQYSVRGGEGEVTLARSVAGQVVVPAELTDELVVLLEHRRLAVRLDGVTMLGEWLQDGDPRRMAAAQIELERLADPAHADREHPQITHAARSLLRDWSVADRYSAERTERSTTSTIELGSREMWRPYGRSSTDANADSGKYRAGWPIGTRYQLEKQLGRGAFGALWRGRVVQTGEAVAIKVFAEELANDANVVTRLLREWGALIRLRHRSLVSARDLVVEGDLLAMVMQLVEGPDLRSYLGGRGTLSPAEATALVADMAEVLAVVHTAGIVHRNVKPAKVLLQPEPEGYRPLLTGFSIARMANEETWHITGTPYYVAPELISGAAATSAVDVYACGIMFMELVTGHPPFRGSDTMEIFQAHQTAQPQRPPGVSDALWAVVRSMLEKNPADRPDATESAMRLRSAL